MEPKEQAAAIIDKANDTAAKVVHDAKNTAQAVLSTAQETAMELVKHANTEPTNAELQEMFLEHSNEDIKQFDGIHKRLDDLPTKEDIGKIATKEDLQNLEQLVKAANITVGVFRFSWNNASKIGTFLLLIGGVVVFIKYGIIGIIAYFIGPKIP